jgi:hypothetical protein
MDNLKLFKAPMIPNPKNNSKITLMKKSKNNPTKNNKLLA